FMPTAETFSPNIFYAGGNAIFQASVLAVSEGDEADTPLYAPTIGPAFFPLGLPNILVNGIPAIALMCPSISNAGNATVGAVMVPSAVNVFLMHAGGAAMTRADLEQLLRALEAPGGPGRGALLSEAVGYIRIGTFTSAVPSMVYGAVRDLE